MRPIKFRAWDKENKNMVWNQFSITAYGHVQKSEPAREYHSWKNEDWLLMQFTGLHDKNGKEIYEGDIVKTENKATGICKWSDKDLRFSFDCNEPMWSHPIYGMGGEKEVIGNICEHPDLLT